MGEVVSERVIYEDGNYVLKRYERGGLVFDYRLVIKGLKVSSRLYCYEAEDFGLPIYVVSAILKYEEEPWNELNISRYYVRDDDPFFKELRKRVDGIRTPRDFILVFMDVVSPALADLCREVVKSDKSG